MMLCERDAILAIESSCDETSAAVVVNGKKVLSNVINSQIDIHKKFGGVVPEIASRKHIEAICPVVSEALKEAGKTLDDISAIAVTKGPGLIGSLLVGISYAKAVAYSKKLPLVSVNHLKGHIFSATIEHDIPYPFIALLVSGGHTELYLVKSYYDLALLGRTRDDAAGEAFDKASKLLGLGYPGGVVIDALSKSGDKKFHNFPRASISKDSFDFSFSGLKTSFRSFIMATPGEFVKENLNSIVASYQEAIVDILVSKTFKAAKKYQINNVVVAGGVAANSRLREVFLKKAAENNASVYIPSKVFCTDNAAMIGVAGHFEFVQGKFEDLRLNGASRYSI